MSNPAGIIFDIKELAVFDGPGIRTTVFLKGCPLRCRWCHNPEGLSPRPQLMVSHASCTGCGRCRAVCPHEVCTACGACVTACPLRLRRICGRCVDAGTLTEELLSAREFLLQNGGGVTFSGGEPLMQPEFLAEMLRRLGRAGLHTAVETSGYAVPSVFRDIAALCGLVLLDIKLADPALHRRYTGVDNKSILENLRGLGEGATPFRVRIPLIPGVSDTEENLSLTASLLKGNRQLQMVELLPYHKTAGAKYSMLGEAYEPGFDTAAPPRVDGAAFEREGIPWTAL